MVSKAEDKPITRTAELIRGAMDEQNLSIREVAIKANVSYEHIANMLRPGSKVVPSTLLIQELARILKIDKSELKQAGVVDTIQKKWGALPLELTGKNPELEPIERAWSKLSKDHKADIIAMAQTFAKLDAAKD